MSQENVELIPKVLAAFNKRDRDAWWASVAHLQGGMVAW